LPEERPLPALQASRKALARYITGPIIHLLARTGITPNALTVFSLVVTVGAAALAAFGHLIAAGLVMLFASVFDILDGALARATDQVTRFGGALDSTLDRLAEGLMMIGLLVFFAHYQSTAKVALVGLTLISSLLVSYVRARAEGLGLDCQVGIFTRPERVIVLALGLILSGFNYVLVVALAIILVLSSITVGQRLYHVWKQTKTGNTIAKR